VALVAAVLVVPLALLLLGGLDDEEGPVGAQSDEQADDPEAPNGEDPADPDAPDGQDGEEEAEPDGDGAEPDGDEAAPDGDGAAPDGDGAAPDGDPDGELEPLDLPALAGIDRTYGRLLTDIDASERAMIGFQDGLAEALGGAADPQEALDTASEVAADSRDTLLAVRERLATPIDDPGADRVRELYVAHLDAWEGFMAAVEDDPLAAVEQGDSGATVRINATADAFARGLEAELPEGIDGDVARYAEELLDRGFRDMGYSDV